MAKLFKNVLISQEELILNKPVEQQHKQATELPEEQLEHLKKEAYQQGYLAGITESKNSMEHEMTQLKHQLQELLLSIPQAVAQNRLELSQEIADIVLLISQQFFVTQQRDSQALSQQVNQILSQLNSKHAVELYLHPLEIAALQKGDIQLETSHLQGLKIKSDESLTLGGYVIKSTHGVFDASIDKQIEKLKDVLVQIRQGKHHASLD